PISGCICASISQGGTAMSRRIAALSAVTRRTIAAAFLVLGSVFILVAGTSLASAEDKKIVVGVDGERITATDVEQRRKFDQLSTHGEWSRKEVVEELIAEKRKLSAARRSGIDVAESDVDAAYANIARRMHLTPEQLTGALAHAGIDAATLKHRVRADIAW